MSYIPPTVGEMDIPVSLRIIKILVFKIFKLLNDCYEPLYGVVPITKKLEEQFVDQFKLAVNLRYLCLVVDKEDKLIGFGLAFPNFANAMKKMKGKLVSPYIFKLLHDLKHPKVVDFALFAVDEAYRTKGVTAFIFNKITNTLIEDNILYAESLLQLEDNITIQNQFDGFEREFHKRRRCYIKSVKSNQNKNKKTKRNVAKKTKK